MFVFQRTLMYLPSKNLAAPQNYGVEAEIINLPTVDGETITSWYIQAEAGMPTVIHLHGNAGNIGDRFEVYNALGAEGFGVLALEWRGYGTSTGSPSEEGFYHDARAAINYLKEQKINESEMVLYGESIGSGTAVQMATEISAKGLILEAPFTSLWERAAELYWYLPVKWMVWDKYDSMSKILQVKEPLLIIHNTGDRIVPYHHGKALYEAANEPKKLLSFESNEHVWFDRALIARELKDFLELN